MRVVCYCQWTVTFSFPTGGQRERTPLTLRTSSRQALLRRPETFIARVWVEYLEQLPSASPTGDLFGARFFDLSAIISGTTTPVTSTNKPYTITVNYTDREKGGAIEDTLGLYWWEGGQWTLEPTSSVDMANNRLTAHPDHMTLFAVLGETKRVYLPLVLR